MNNQKVRNVDFLLFSLTLFLTSYMAWKYWFDVGDFVIDYWQYAPNRYRLWEQLLLMLSGSFSITLLNIMSWFASFLIASLILHPIRGKEQRIIICWYIFVCLSGAFYNGPMFIILALLLKYHDNKYISLLLIPLTLMKEVVGLIGFLYLWIVGKKETSYIGGILGGISYISMRLLLGEVGYAPPPFIQQFAFLEVLNRLNPSLVLFYVMPLCLLLGLSFIQSKMNRRKALFVLLSSIPIFIFAIPWEPQLWFPMVFLLLNYEVNE